LRSPSDQRCAKRESLWPDVSRSSCARCCETEPSSSSPKPRKPRDSRPNPAPKRSDAQEKEQTTAWIVEQGPTVGRLRFQPSRASPSLPHQVSNEHAENAGTRRASAIDPLENTIRRFQTPLKRLICAIAVIGSLRSRVRSARRRGIGADPSAADQAGPAAARVLKKECRNRRQKSHLQVR
jgi:hypothetical protein